MDSESDEAGGIPIPTPNSFPATGIVIPRLHVLMIKGSADRNKASQEEALRKYVANCQKSTSTRIKVS